MNQNTELLRAKYVNTRDVFTVKLRTQGLAGYRYKGAPDDNPCTCKQQALRKDKKKNLVKTFFSFLRISN